MADGIAALPGGARMSRLAVVGLLAVCALLEAGGDALIRSGMRANRPWFYAAGAAVLFAYGWLVNRPPWAFGTLLGIYVVLFFAVAQALAVVVFHEKLTTPVLAGGSLIVAGGLLMTLWR